LAGGLN